MYIKGFNSKERKDIRIILTSQIKTGFSITSASFVVFNKAVNQSDGSPVIYISKYTICHIRRRIA